MTRRAAASLADWTGFHRAPWAAAIGQAVVLLAVLVGWERSGPGQDPPVSPRPGPAPSDRPLAERLHRQQRAQATATELVKSVLDVQLRQLRENRLEQSPMYGEISAMRANLDRLVSDQMPAVSELLQQAPSAGEARVGESQAEIRTRVRDIVTALMSERHKLRQRLQLARVSAQARQLLERQTRVWHRTQQLPEEEPAARERLTLAALEDQRDAGTLYTQLVASLQQAGEWKGANGEAAAKGNQLLVDADAQGQLRAAELALAGGRFDQALPAQQKLIESLRALLEVLEPARGRDRGDPRLARAAAELRDRQRQLHEETQEADLSDAAQSEGLAERQRSIQNELDQLSVSLPQGSAAQASLARAREAAVEAETRLFEGDRDRALQQQDDVSAALDEAVQQLEENPDPSGPGEAAAPEDATRLEKLRQQLEGIRPLQAQVARDAAVNLEAATAGEEQVAQRLDEAMAPAGFQPPVQRRLDEARDAVHSAREALGGELAAAGKVESARQALRAIEHALREVQSALAAVPQPGAAGEPAGEPSPDGTAKPNPSADPAGGKPANSPTPSAATRPRTSPSEAGDGAQPAEEAIEDQRPRIAGAQRDQQPRSGAGPGGGDIPQDTPHYELEPWFLQLPPAVRAAVQGTTRRPPPRGFEERLRRYFEAM